VHRDFSRRHVLVGGTGLVVGFTLTTKGWGEPWPDKSTPKATIQVSDWQRLAWLWVAPDGALTIYCATTELGQGAATPLMQVMADELDVPPDRVRVVQAPVTPPFIRKAGNGKFY
jgi:nicotinate dehydrogenase subunit B